MTGFEPRISEGLEEAILLCQKGHSPIIGYFKHKCNYLEESYQ